MKEPRFRIDSFSFGKVTINGKSYESDLIICLEEIVENWWRRKGHGVYPEDLEFALSLNPEVIVIGCGVYNRLKVPGETKKWLRERRIEIVEAPTAEACDRYNELARVSRTIAGLHLTC